MRQLSGTDTLMLYQDRPHAQNVIAPIGIYDAAGAPGGRVSYEDILAFVQSRLHISESFRERLVRVPLGLDRPYWIRDPDFDLEYHIRQVALPRPGDWSQFCTQVARICSRPLDLTRPPWEMYIIEGLDSIPDVPPGAFAMVLKLHHAAVDGVAGAEMVTVLHDPEAIRPDPAVAAASPSDWVPEEAPSTQSLLFKAGLHAVRRPFGFAGLLVPAVRNVPSAVRSIREGSLPAIGPLPPMGTPVATRFNAGISPHRVFGVVRVPLASLKRIKDSAPGAKLNDVGMAVVSGAIRRYLAGKDELSDESLIALMPISVRPTQTQRPTGVEVEAGVGGNRFAMMPVSMATNIADPMERLVAIQEATAAAKGADAASAQSLTEMAELVPGAVMGSVQRAIVRTFNRRGRALGTHTIVTNVPGPRVPVYFCGARAVTITGMAPVADGMGLINAIGGYADEVPICFTADRNMMPDPEFYEECLLTSFEELLALAEPESVTDVTDGATVRRSRKSATAAS
jgi:diacylglycerol O-acyltransferase